MRFKLELNGNIEYFTAYENPPRTPYFSYVFNNKTYYLMLSSSGNSKFRIYGKIPINNDVVSPPDPVTRIISIGRGETMAGIQWSYSNISDVAGFELSLDGEIKEACYEGLYYTFTNITTKEYIATVTAVGLTGLKSEPVSHIISSYP